MRGYSGRRELLEMLIQSTIEERESRARFLDGFEELVGYYQVVGCKFTHLYKYLEAPFSVSTGSNP